MPHWRSLIPGEYIKAADVGGRDVTLTIVRVERKEIDKLAKPEGADGVPGKEKRGVVSFKETDKTMPLNVTNAACMAAMWGDDYSAWAGHRVTLYSGRDRLGRDEVDALRVRGAPDLSEPIGFEIPRPRRRPIKVTLIRTGAPQLATPEREPGSEG